MIRQKGKKLKELINKIYFILRKREYFYYLFFVAIFFYTTIVSYEIIPVASPDSYAYLWLKKAFFKTELPGISFNYFFFMGRSLTQRSVFHLLGNNFSLIFLFQSFLNLVVIIVFFKIFKSKIFLRNILLLIFLSLLQFSSFFRLSPSLIGPEPLYFSLFVFFILTIFYFRGSRRNLWLFIVGIFFIFSKQVSPFIVIVSILLYLLINYRRVRIKEKVISSILCIISICSIFFTQRYDSSVKVNAINNIFSRVLISKERINYFINNYSLPKGQYLELCNGGEVNSLCLGIPIYSINKNTRNYEIMEEAHPFLIWINSNKNYPYIKYCIHNWVDTLEELNEGFQFVFRKGPLRFFSEYIDQLSMARVTSHYPKFEIFFLNILGALGTGINFIFLNHLFFAIFFNLLVMLLIKRHRNLSSIILIIIFSFTISYLGDGMEHLRHTYISTILYIIFTYLLIMKIIFDIFIKLKAYLKSSFYRG